MIRAAGSWALLNARSGIWWDAAALALLACTALVVLAMPVFPSQDGPVHLYYVDILRSLLTHSGPYTQHFEIKSFLTPYALEYYSLLALEMAFSPELSEKLLVCCYIFAFGLGFRYLVESVAERRCPWSLAGIPFCMNALVYKGFLNYCLGVAVALFLCGFWIRGQGRFRPGRAAALLVCFVLMLLTHPVPVAVFVLFAGLHFVADLARAAAAGSGLWLASLRARWWPLAMIALMAATAALWVALFASQSQHVPSGLGAVFRYGWIRTVDGRLLLWPVLPFTSPSYRIGPVLLVVTPGLALMVSVWKQGGRAGCATIALIATAAICFTSVCIAPESINGSHYFPDRFAVFWVVLLIAAAAASRPPRQWSLAAGVMALCVSCAVLLLQWVNVSRIALEMRPLLEAPPAQVGSVGLVIGGKASRGGDLVFEPFLWGGAHYFRRSGAILANAPWMDLPIVMLRPAHPNRWSYLNPYSAGLSLSRALTAGGAPSDLSFVVRDGPSSAAAEALLSGPGWSPLTRTSGAFCIYAHHP
ncbi:MAG: hypothetical protein ABSC08_01055 [Bryobacteraceae bacterium]